MTETLSCNKMLPVTQHLINIGNYVAKKFQPNFTQYTS